MMEMHRDHGPAARIKLIADILTAKGMTPTKADQTDYEEQHGADATRRILSICKQKKFTWRKKQVACLDHKGEKILDYFGRPEKYSKTVPPENLNEALIKTLAELNLIPADSA